MSITSEQDQPTLLDNKGDYSLKGVNTHLADPIPASKCSATGHQAPGVTPAPTLSASNTPTNSSNATFAAMPKVIEADPPPTTAPDGPPVLNINKARERRSKQTNEANKNPGRSQRNNRLPISGNEPAKQSDPGNDRRTKPTLSSTKSQSYRPATRAKSSSHQ
jgi:hypothetical protein